MKKYIWIALAILLAFGLTACGAPAENEMADTAQTVKPEESATPVPPPEPTEQPDPETTPQPLPEAETEYVEAGLTLFDMPGREPGNPYDMAYQSEVRSALATQIEAGSYTMEAPFASIDPYGTSQLSMLLYFSGASGYVSYTIASPYSDEAYTKTVSEAADEHYIEVFGLYPDTTNQVIVSLYNEHDQMVKQATYTLEVPSIKLGGVSDPNNPLSVKIVSSGSGLSKGLFGMMGTIEPGHGYENVYFYDNHGYLRGMFDTEFRADTMLRLEDGFLFPYDTTTIVYVTDLGETIAMYNLPGYKMHHDLEVDSSGNILALVTKSGSGYKEDRLLSIDMETGEIEKELDFKTLFGNLGSFYKLNGGDWLHANSIDYIDQKGGNIIVSGRENSMLFSLTGVDSGEFSLEYVINEGRNAAKMGVEEVNLAPAGDVNYCLGQHSAYYIPGSDEDHYQIVYYNNFYTLNNENGSRKNLINYTDITGGKLKSYATVLDIDIEAMTFGEALTIELDFSKVRSSAIKWMDNYIVSSTEVSQIFELDKDFNVILELALGGRSGVYRCNKYQIYD